MIKDSVKSAKNTDFPKYFKKIHLNMNLIAG